MTERRLYRSNGKFLLTGEYLVMFGARALALPLKRGQDLAVSTGESGAFRWESHYGHECWFSCDFDPVDFEIGRTTDPQRAATLKKLLLAGRRLAREQPALNISPKERTGFPDIPEGVRITTRLDFKITWGMGSSSTLISNVASLMNVDPYELYWQVSDGSAYDIACARSDKPLIYSLVNGLPDVLQVDFHPPFSNGLYFVYSGRKQFSHLSAGAFRKNGTASTDRNRQAGQITDALVGTRDQEEFNALIDEHESMMSGILDRPALKNSKYGDFTGSIKSLGAWGGDFFLASSMQGGNYIRDYFNRKGHDVLFAYDELVL